MKHKLTELQAFNAMRSFLEKYYKMTNSDDIASLLSGMQFLVDDSTVDPAIWLDWEGAVSKVLKEPEQSREYLNLRK